jgi:hypothetical protein
VVADPQYRRHPARRDGADPHVTGVARTARRDAALVEKYGDRHSADRVFELS